jgi:hypothetical protein
MADVVESVTDPKAVSFEYFLNAGGLFIVSLVCYLLVWFVRYDFSMHIYSLDFFGFILRRNKLLGCANTPTERNWGNVGFPFADFAILLIQYVRIALFSMSLICIVDLWG